MRAIARQNSQPISLQQLMASGALVFIAAMFFLVPLLSVVFILWGRDDVLFILISECALLVILLPTLVRIGRFDPFDPMFLVAFSYLLGVGLRAPYLVANYGTSERVDYLLRGQTFADVNAHAIWFLIGTICLVAGYMTVRRRIPLERFAYFSRARFSTARLAIASVAFAVIGLGATILYIRNANIDLSQGLLAASNKNPLAYQTADGRIVYGAGVEYFIAQLAKVPFITLVVLLAIGGVRRSPFWFAVAGALLLASAFVPFLASSRMDLLLIALTIVVALVYFGKVSTRALLAVGLVLGVMVVFMGELRSENQGDDGRYGGVVDLVVGSGNMIDVTQTSSIIERVPKETAHLNGASYLSLVTAAIPRALWPEKPNTSLGPWVKQEIYHYIVRNNGWPPGMIAEAHINFGVWGIPPVMFLFGMLLRLVYLSFQPLLGVSVVYTLLYAAFIWRLGFGTISLNFAQGIMQSLIGVVPFLFFLALVLKSPPKAQRPIGG